MKAEILPGILTHTFEEYAARLEMVESSSALWAHIDFADGQFVPNITVMPHEIMSLSTRLKIEAHLMTYRPERYFSDLTVAGVVRVWWAASTSVARALTNWSGASRSSFLVSAPFASFSPRTPAGRPRYIACGITPEPCWPRRFWDRVRST